MPLLNKEQERQTVAIVKATNIRDIEQDYNAPAKLLCGEQWIKASCLKCSKPKCLRYSQDEICSSEFPDFSFERDLHVCPVDSIKWNYKEEIPEIDNYKCIKCGLCASRCPVGAIYKKNNQIEVANDLEGYEILAISTSSIQLQQKCIEVLEKIYWKKHFQRESNAVLNDIYQVVKKFDGRSMVPNILVRNLLIELGYNCSISRQGDIYTRMDGVYSNYQSKGVIEIEFGKDTLDASRGILDDIAVLHSRNNIDKNDNKALVVCLSFPNKRQGYFQVIKDVNKILNIQIQTLSLGALLVLMWNGANINLGKAEFYADFDNLSIRQMTEYRLQRCLNISQGYLGIFEPEK